MKFSIILVSSITIFSSMSFAQTTKTSPNTNQAKLVDVEAKDIRCEKHTGTGLADFKEALVENCNLNKPFSTSLSRMLNDEVYFYCCHKKATVQ